MTSNHARVVPTKADEGWSEWIEWSGGDMPVSKDTEVQWKGRGVNENGIDGSIAAGLLYWGHLNTDMDIIAYRYRMDDNTMTPEEEEAWQAKERELVGGPRAADNFLNHAATLLTERGKQYDQPGGERSMGKAVSALNAITGRDLAEAEGWLLLSLVKRARQYSGAGYHRDSAEDAVAYSALEAEALESGR